jgi:hypothetical protein
MEVLTHLKGLRLLHIHLFLSIFNLRVFLFKQDNQWVRHSLDDGSNLEPYLFGGKGNGRLSQR